MLVGGAPGLPVLLPPFPLQISLLLPLLFSLWSLAVGPATMHQYPEKVKFHLFDNARANALRISSNQTCHLLTRPVSLAGSQARAPTKSQIALQPFQPCFTLKGRAWKDCCSKSLSITCATLHKLGASFPAQYWPMDR